MSIPSQEEKPENRQKNSGSPEEPKFQAVTHRLREVLGDRTIREFVSKLGLEYSTCHDYFAGKRQPSAEFLTRLQETEYISPLWVIAGKGAKLVLTIGEEVKADDASNVTLLTTPLHRVPVFDIGGAFDGDWTDGQMPVGRGHMEVPVPTLDPGAFGCVLHGDSMEPDFREGDILVFEPGEPVMDGDYCMVRTQDWATFKQVFFEEDKVRLVPLNRRYPERVLDRTGEEIVGMAKLAWHSRRH
jgi:phage repressor protein C with HTH and peptisase S24 domain